MNTQPDSQDRTPSGTDSQPDSTQHAPIDDADTQASQPNAPPDTQEVGSVSSGATADPSPGGGLPDACVRDGETRKRTWERLRREGRASGMTRKAAIGYASREVDRLYPLEPPLGDASPKSQAVSDDITRVTKTEGAKSATHCAFEGVSGLDKIPADWPKLPPNASLQAEIAWVQASRLDVVRETPEGTVVDLSRADSPAPSKAAIGWLETSIRAYSKYCDIAAKATQQQEHEVEQVRRERQAIEEIRELLVEMLPAKG